MIVLTIQLRYPALESLGDKSKGTETEKSTQHSVYYHALGTDPSTDRLIVSDPEHPDYNHNAQVSDDGKYCIISVSESTDPVNMLYVLPLEGQSLPAGELPELIKLATNFDSKYEYITNEGPIFYFLTNKDNALNGKVVSIDIRDGTVDKSKDVVPENPTDPLESYTCVDGNKLILGYLHNVSSALRIHDLTSGKLIKELDIPICSVGSLFGRKQMKEFYYRMTSFTLASRIVKYSFENDSEEIFRDAKLTNFNPDLFKVEQKFFTSKDGTQVPMFLVHRKDLKLDGTNPVFLYGYGGFNIPLGPSFSVSRIIFADNFRGVYALANLRGGGEFGEKWHKAGQRENKQNVFDDFHAAAEFLIKEKYTKDQDI
ncbi:hypothetical protein H696_04860 [Fonticula alba]|uniref:Prolyl endopeptidase n=1 Tax=Fonticula alba TaxID=691883 RepID=A0A058Z4Y3_FONAL|nr:hypothetical protein H696_04860 [Fonticula alba]KCV68567.1 hypothetical protein H696_04860 [Fonticula alba]|eukprot:XP_009496999.1 hypothetical protein H696_04860 [Fonticula alba]